MNLKRERERGREREVITACQHHSHQTMIMGVQCAGGQGRASAWDTWVKDALTRALDAAPMDLHDAWAAAVRYGVNGLAQQPTAHLGLLLPAVLQPVPAGELMYLHGVGRV